MFSTRTRKPCRSPAEHNRFHAFSISQPHLLSKLHILQVGQTVMVPHSIPPGWPLQKLHALHTTAAAVHVGPAATGMYFYCFLHCQDVKECLGAWQQLAGPI
jgi:hypothetical protein